MLIKAQNEKLKTQNEEYKAISSYRGFTLVEVVTALFIATVGIIGGYDLVNQSLASAKTATLQLTAAYLGKEGIDIARNIRDSNYLKIYNGQAGYGPESWESGLSQYGSPVAVDCTGAQGSQGCRADYTSDSLSDSNPNKPLKIDPANGLYNYGTGPSSGFKRKITVTDSPDGSLNISVRVNWSERGHDHSLTVQENLYNWMYE